MEVMAESLHGHGQTLILANVKGPVAENLAAAHVPVMIEKHGGHLCTGSVDDALQIAAEKSFKKMDDDLIQLAKRTTSARNVLRSQQSSLYTCGSPAAMCGLTAPSKAASGHTPPSSPKRSQDTGL